MITEEEIKKSRRSLNRLINEIEGVIVGHKRIIEMSIITLLSRGNILLEGVPGLGKTLLVRATASALDLKFSRIQFTPDLMPADITGTNILKEENGERKFSFSPGPIFANLILADEINRATPKTQSALLEAMEEETVTVGNETHFLNRPFIVMATQNPIEMEGTYPLPESQIDRFSFKVDLAYPDRAELTEITNRNTENGGISLPEPVSSGEEIILSQKIVDELPVPEELKKFTSKLVLATDPQNKSAPENIREYVDYGSSPRGSLALIRGAKARAFLKGEYNVSKHDIERVYKPAIRHRLILNFKAESEGVDVEELLDEVWKSTEV